MLSDDLSRINDVLGIKIEYLNRTTSTNDLAAAVAFGEKKVFWAELQTKGRGQRGNSWESEFGKNLTFSLSLFPCSLEAVDQFYISKIVSIALIETLSCFQLEAKIKWPNDIYIQDSKICGVLIENDLKGAHIVRSIAGIGLNVNQLQFDQNLPNPVSMLIASGKEFKRTDVLQKILERIFDWETKLLAGHRMDIDDTYHRHLYRKHGYFYFKEPNGSVFLAEIEQVHPSGELILHQKDGETRGYFFKEVEFIIP